MASRVSAADWYQQIVPRYLSGQSGNGESRQLTVVLQAYRRAETCSLSVYDQVRHAAPLLHASSEIMAAVMTLQAAFIRTIPCRSAAWEQTASPGAGDMPLSQPSGALIT